MERADKSAAVYSLATAIEQNEPEAAISTLQRLFAKAAEGKHISEQERERWRIAADALEQAVKAVNQSNATPKSKSTDSSAEGRSLDQDWPVTGVSADPRPETSPADPSVTPVD